MGEKSKKNIKNTYKGWLHSKIVNCQFVPNGILGNLLMTLIDLVSQRMTKFQKISKTPTRVDYRAKMSIADLFLMEF